MTAIGDALRQSLADLNLDGLSRSQVTTTISKVVRTVLEDSGLGTVYSEMSTGARLQPPSGKVPRLGYVDFAIAGGSGVLVALEIDGSDKRFSLRNCSTSATGERWRSGSDGAGRLACRFLPASNSSRSLCRRHPPDVDPVLRREGLRRPRTPSSPI